MKKISKNQHFADWFKSELEKVNESLDSFATKGEEQFGDENAFPASHILGMLNSITGEWEKTVIENVQEGYPSIDVYHESL